MNTNDDGTFLIVISGVVNEYAQKTLRSVPSQLDPSQKIEINLKDVDAINSIGTIYWAELLKNIAMFGPTVLTHCSIAIVDCMNRVPSLADNLKVESFYIPFRCTRCNRLTEHYIKLADLPESEFSATVCKKCNETMTPEVNFDDYTAFRAYTKDGKAV